MGKLRVAVIAMVACGSSQHAGTKTSDVTTATVKKFEPLGARAESKVPSQAVILGTDDKNGSTVVPLPTGSTKAVVDAMYVRMGGLEKATGGMTPVKLATAPNPDQSVQVGIFEEFAGGTGAQWRAGVWVSAIVAATMLNKDLTDFTFSASSTGYIDGASASGLMAGGFLASMTGVDVDPKVTMTGIINPDGTIGPVGGIPEKFLGSIEKGKTRVGFPIGMRYARSEASGELVDLVKLAKDHKAEAVEIADVHEAYKLLTGKQLPQAVPVSADDMKLDPTTTKALDAKYLEWQRLLAAEWATILELDSAGRLPKSLVALKDMAKRYGDEAERLHKSGRIAAGYTRMLAAWVYATGTTQIYDMASKVQGGDVAGAVASLDALDRMAMNSTAVFQKIGALRPSTLGGHLQMLSAFRAALRGWASYTFARSAIYKAHAHLADLKHHAKAELGAPATADDVVTAVMPSVLYINKTLVETAMAMQQLDFETEESVNYMCSIPNVRRMATSFQSASAAGLNYFDTLIVDPYAKSMRISEDEARQVIAMRDSDYLIAFMTSRLNEMLGLPKELKEGWGEKSLAWGLASLAGSELAYLDSAELIAKYYSLRVKTDDSGKIIAIEHDKAFVNMLAAAERSARASARAARIATGAIPVQAKLAFEVATVERDGTLDERVDALGEFWASSAMSQTAVMLARN